MNSDYNEGGNLDETSSGPEVNISSHQATNPAYSGAPGNESNAGDATVKAPWDRGAVDEQTGPITDDYADIANPGTTTLDEEFAGTGGIGSSGEQSDVRN